MYNQSMNISILYTKYSLYAKCMLLLLLLNLLYYVLSFKTDAGSFRKHHGNSTLIMSILQYLQRNTYNTVWRDEI